MLNAHLKMGASTNGLTVLTNMYPQYIDTAFQQEKQFVCVATTELPKI